MFVAASDYVKALPESVSQWLPRPLGGAGHRRLRPQREPRRAARLLRGGRQAHRAGHPLGAAARGPDHGRLREAAAKELRHQSREAKPSSFAKEQCERTIVAIEFKLPELGENIETGDLVRVMISPGAQVTKANR